MLPKKLEIQKKVLVGVHGWINTEQMPMELESLKNYLG